MRTMYYLVFFTIWIRLFHSILHFQVVHPNKLKYTKVIPPFKKGDKKDVNNYRPISIISVFSKVKKTISNITSSLFRKF